MFRAIVTGGIILLAFAGARARDDRPPPGAGPDSQAIAIHPPGRAAGTAQFDLGSDTANCGRLLRLLARDRIRVVWADTGAGGGLTVRVKMPVARFKSIFQGKLVKLEVARSSYDGYAIELFLEGYVIPKRYKKCLRWVRLPDTQLE